jgi:protein SCO1
MVKLKWQKTMGMWMLSGLFYATSGFSAEVSEAANTGDAFVPPFKMDCVSSTAQGRGIADRVKLSMNMSEHAQHDHHAHHQMMMEQKDYKVTTAEYSVPDVVLTSHKGEKVNLPQLLASGKPMMLNFIFTTCTTICPVLSASFHQVQEILGEDQSVALISITIDPEYDTPEQLMKYSKRFKANDNWQFYTGSYNDVVNVEKAFDIFRGSKMSHEPITLIRGDVDTVWTRIDGLASAEDIVKEYRNIMDKKK